MAWNTYYVYYELIPKWGNTQSSTYTASAKSEFEAIAQAKKHVEEKVKKEQWEGYEIKRVEKSGS